MRTKCGPNCTNIFMGSSIFLFKNLLILINNLFINNIFPVWNGTKREFKNFVYQIHRSHTLASQIYPTNKWGMCRNTVNFFECIKLFCIELFWTFFERMYLTFLNILYYVIYTYWTRPCWANCIWGEQLYSLYPKNLFWSNLTYTRLKPKNYKNHLSIPPFATMGKSLHSTYYHCRNPESIYKHHRPTW